jgi:molybdopterin-containing oxidoreductase family iron-sulfur binding subunit
MRYGMVIDLKKCVGCMACTIACKAENQTRPGIFWNIVKDKEFGEYPMVTRVFLPTPCMHCREAPCVKVCPTGASHRREDGIVIIDYDKCIGCKYCIEACPYGARYFNGDPSGYFGTELTEMEKVGYARHKQGVVEKCTFCIDLVTKGKEPACVRTCIGGARYFGDLGDPDSKVSQLIKSRHGSQLLKELGTDPSVYYLPA